MANNKIRIRLKSFDHKILDASAEKIISSAKKSGAQVVGPVPLPTEKEVYTILRAVHKYKDSREQFEIRTHKRLIDIVNPTPETVDVLTRLELPSGVDIEIKFIGLRPGEKLYEEMLMKEEGMKTTPNKMIHIGQPIQLPDDFFDQLDHLYQVAYDEDSNIRKEVHQMVDTYHYDENTTHGVKNKG